MKLRLAASGWIAEEPRGVRLRFWNDTSIGLPPDEIRVERAMLPQQLSVTPAYFDPWWLDTPAEWWSEPETVALGGDPLVVWELGRRVEGVAFDYDGPRARVVATLGGASVWSRVIGPGEFVHIQAPCDRVTIRAMAAVLRSARLFDPASRAYGLIWSPIATVLLRVGLSRPWSEVAPRASSLLWLDEEHWQTLAATIASRFDTTLPAEPTIEQAQPEIVLSAGWATATVCGFGFRDGPGRWAKLDDVDPAALLSDEPTTPLAYRIVDPSGIWEPSAPVAVPAGRLGDLAPPPLPAVRATVSLAPDDRLTVTRTLTWGLGDSLADRAAFYERYGQPKDMPWEIRSPNGTRHYQPDVIVSTLPYPELGTAITVQQLNGDSWGRWSPWSEVVYATPTPDHRPSPPPLLNVFAKTGWITVTLGTAETDPTARWQLDRLARELNGRLEVLRRRSPPETLEIELGMPVEVEMDLWRYDLTPAINPAQFKGGVVNTGGTRCDVIEAEPNTIFVRATNDGAFRRRIPATGEAMLVAPRDRADLWESVGEVAAPGAGEDLKLVDCGIRANAIYAVRVVYDGGMGPLSNEVRAHTLVEEPPPPPNFRARFQAFDAAHHAVFIVAFDEPPAPATLRIGWTWSDVEEHPRFAREPLVGLDEITFLARVQVPNRIEVLPAVNLWASHETAAGIGHAVRGELEPVVG